jgi:thioredoxin-dependent peroxiredoxin
MRAPPPARQKHPPTRWKAARPRPSSCPAAPGSDTSNRVTRLYGVYKKKSLYGREFMGIERTTFVIDRAGVIRKVFPKVKVASHADAVIEAVKALR